MTYHSKSGKEFVGLRIKPNGKHQVIYDAQAGMRVVVDIQDHKTNLSAIDDALREGVDSRNVLSGVLNGLKRRNIGFDLPL